MQLQNAIYVHSTHYSVKFKCCFMKLSVWYYWRSGNCKRFPICCRSINI